MDRPGPSEVGPDPERRVIDINDFRFAEYSDDRFASIQLAEWVHPKIPKQTIVETILTAAYGKTEDPWNHHLSNLLNNDIALKKPIDPADPYFDEIIEAIVKAGDIEQIEAIEIVRRLHAITINGTDPIGPSPNIPIILDQIIGSE